MAAPTTCSAHIKDYCANCTFGGVHYIADDKKHWTERWLWVALVVVSWYGSAILIIAAWNAFQSSPISFGVETDYLTWDTRMPTVAFCEVDNVQKVWDVADRIWTPNHSPDLDDVLKEISYFRGLLFNTIPKCYKSEKNKFTVDPMCPLDNYTNLAKLVRSKCPELLANCSYNDNHFHCCDFFQEIDTDIGPCYILNSIQVKKPNPLPMIHNITHKKGVVKFEVLLPSKMYTMSDDEVPSLTTLQSTILPISVGYRYRRQVTVLSIENDPLIVQTTPKQRACRFHSENEDGLYPHYSYSACTVLCRKRAQLHHCGCNDHFMPGTLEEQHCNISGLHCLVSHHNELTILKPHWAQRRGLACDCLPSCSEAEIIVVQNDEHSDQSLKKKKSVVELILTYLPTERFKRRVVRSRLDLVVSIGGTTGLFVGASIISFVELIVYFTVRYFNNILMQQKIDRAAIEHVSENDGIEIHRASFLDGETENNHDDDTAFQGGIFESTGVPESKALYDKLVASYRPLERQNTFIH